MTIEGDVELVGPDDLLEELAPERLLPLSHEIYAAATGSSPADWVTRDSVIEAERHIAVLLRPTRMYSNPTSADA